jgi:hypothetical protein
VISPLGADPPLTVLLNRPAVIEPVASPRQ